MAPNIVPRKNSLAIRVTESAVFLRTDYTPTRRNVQPTSSTRNGLLRGLLVLDLAKPTRISSIEVELTGTTSTAWPEGVGSRRVEVNEEHRIFHASTTYFRACPPGPSSSSHTRRTASIGPGITYNHSQTVHCDIEDSVVDDEDDDSLEEDSSEDLSGRLRRRAAASAPSTSAALGTSSARVGDSPNQSSRSNPSSPIIRPPVFSRASSRRVSIDGSQLTRPSPLLYESYPGELAPIPPYSVLPPCSPNFSSTTNGHLAFDASSSDPQRASYAETIPEDELEARFDHHGLLRHHEDDEDDEEVGLTVDHEVALESPRPAGVVPSLLQTAVGEHAPILLNPTPLRTRNRGISPAPPIGPYPSTSSSSMVSSSSSGVRGSASRTQLPPPSPNPSLSAPPLSPSALSTHSINNNILQGRPLNAPMSATNSARSRSSNRQSHGLFQRHRSPSSERRAKRFSFSSVTNLFKDALRSGSPKRSNHHTNHHHESNAIMDATRTSVDTMRGRTSIDSLRRQGSRDAQSPARDDRDAHYIDSALDIEEEEEEEEHQRGRSVFGKILLGNGGISGEKDKEGWKEFKRGTYTYPISFSIPSNAPPSMQCDYGSVHWQLKANVHRPGAFKTRMTADREVVIITCPTEEDTEDTENIIVERHWEQQLQYLISVSGRSFHIGGTVPVTLTLMPLAKVKIHRLSVIVEEKVDYYTNMRRITRSDDPVKFTLLQIRRDGKSSKPILPLESNDVDILRESPLMDLFDADKDDLGEVASNLMGPGPWSFHKNLKLPSSCDILRFTNKNKRANMQVTHMLKVVMRVERGDDVHLDKHGNRKLFDIVVQTPVLILSCRCNPEWTSLPRYTQVFDDATDITPSCPCHTHANASHHFRSHSSDDSLASTAETSSIPPLSLRSLRNHQFSDSLVRQSSLFERLVSGQESETGEAPPAYDIPSSKKAPCVLRNVMVVS